MDTSHLEALKIGLIYGSDTGFTEDVGGRIARRFSALGCSVEVMEVVTYDSKKIESYDFVIMGIPTWDFGGIQSDWERSESKILETNLKGTVIALYGLGDQENYSEWFLDAMGWLHERVLEAGASVIGRWSAEEYDYVASLATNDDDTEFCGLAIDEHCQSELTDSRLDEWVAQVVGELKIKIAASAATID